MFNILREVRVMREEGKIHKKLLNQMYILTGIALIILSIDMFEAVMGNLDVGPALVLAAIGFCLGVYLFAPLNAAEWNEEQEIVAAKRIDKVGFAAIAAYILIVIGLRMFLNQNFHEEVTMLVLSLVVGMLLGRVVGTILEIHRAFRAAHP